MKTISLKLPDRLHARLDEIARQRGQSKSEVIRTALEHLLNGTQNMPDVSALDLADDLIGSAEGPRDLSTNPKYMQGYGK